MTPEDLTAIVHDKWFNREDIEFDREESLVKIPVVRKERVTLKRVLLPAQKPKNRFEIVGVIVFKSVTEVKIHDTENIGFYDINKIIYSEDDNEIRILTNCPIDLTMAVESFDAEYFRISEEDE